MSCVWRSNLACNLSSYLSCNEMQRVTADVRLDSQRPMYYISSLE